MARRSNEVARMYLDAGWELEVGTKHFIFKSPCGKRRATVSQGSKSMAYMVRIAKMQIRRAATEPARASG